MKWISLERPVKFEWEKETKSDSFGKFFIEPFEKGFGVTIGNSLRRVMLSYIQGAGLVGIRVDGVSHEFASIDNLKEDVLDVIMNLKKMRVKYTGNGRKKIEFSAKGPCKIYGRDFDGIDPEISVMMPDAYICELSEGGELNMELYYEHGFGYKSVDEHDFKDMPIGFIAVDTVYTPVLNVKYDVEQALVGKSVDYDKLIMEITTDGSIKPETVLKRSVRILKDYLNVFEELDKDVEYGEEEVATTDNRLKELLEKPVSEMELTVRAANCLKGAEIGTIGELVTKTEAEMLKYRNFGKKSLEEIKEKLAEMDLHFGMTIDEIEK